MQETGKRTYSELITIPTFEQRFEYLKLSGAVGRTTFGGNRWLNQRFYTSKEWKDFRRDVIVRDNGCDLGIDDGEHQIHDRIIVHHINPITIEDIKRRGIDILLDFNNVICVSHNTHEAIHYGDASLIETYHERTPDDTVLWRNQNVKSI